MEYKRDSGSGFEYEFVNSNGCEEYHCHNRIEIIYIKKGKIRLRTDMSKSVYDVSTGDYAVISGSDVHRCFCMGECQYELFRFPVSYQNMLDGKLVRGSFSISCSVIGENPMIKDTLFHICCLLKQDSLERSIERNLCSTLCSILVSFYDKRKTRDNAEADIVEFNVIQSISFETIEKFDTVLNYINENYAKSKISLESLSNVSGLNKTFLSALFPKLTGSNFKDYLNRLRVDRAIELLTSTENNISEIAFLCGFDTIRTLNNVFKSIAGVTPSDFRFGSSKKSNEGINTEISAVGSAIFSYKWTSTGIIENNAEKNTVYLHPLNPNTKSWIHLNLRMLFYAGMEYRVSFKAKLLDYYENDIVINCNFCFPDDVKKIEHHTPNLLEIKKLNDGWCEYNYAYTVPDYYKPSSLDNFSVYTSPFNDGGISYLLKDLTVKII